MMFLSYEIYILSDRIKQLDTSSISPYKNTLMGLLNSFNNYLNKNNYQDKLDIHKKRNDIQRIFLGCEEDFAKEYKKVK